MELSDKDIAEFMAAWRDAYDETLSPEEARHKAARLMQLYELIARSPKGNDPPGAGETIVSP